MSDAGSGVRRNAGVHNGYEAARQRSKRSILKKAQSKSRDSQQMKRFRTKKI